MNSAEYLDVVGCFLIHQQSFLILLRRADKAAGKTWGLPAGKVDAGENLFQAVIREVKEETSIEISTQNLVLHEDFVFPKYGTRFHAFSYPLDSVPDVVLEPQEHTDFKWVTFTEFLDSDKAIYGLKEVVRTLEKELLSYGEKK